MVFTLQDLMDLPLMASARPEVLSGDHFADRPVRWVHTSEIFEISPLLKGQEVLFTTGLGLVGAPAGAITAYVESLAAQNVTALVMEVGRTFVHLPEEFVTAARAHGLPLITMHRVIPFVEITETVHPILIAAELEGLRRRDHAVRNLTAGLLAGDDLAALVAMAQRMVEAPVGLYSPGGQLLAGDDVRVARPGAALVEEAVGPDTWAILVADVESDSPRAEVVEVAATAVALRLAQRTGGSPTRALAVVDLVSDLAGGRFLTIEEVESRAAVLGFVINPHRLSLALVVDLTGAARAGVTAVTKAARRAFGPNLVAELDGRIVVLAQLREHGLAEDQVAEFADSIDVELALAVPGRVGAARVVRVVCGSLVDSWSGLANSLGRADRGARLARRLAFPSRIVTERDLGLYDLLTRVVPDVELESFVEQQLGPLLQSDARSGHRLVETLNAYIESGQSKSRAAELLGVRRQTLYQRLEKISTLLGGIDLDSRERITALDLAVTAWRMRTSGLTGQRAG